jgi:hypothetical protein
MRQDRDTALPGGVTATTGAAGAGAGAAGAGAGAEAAAAPPGFHSPALTLITKGFASAFISK